MGYRWHSVGEVVSDHPVLEQKAEKAPQCGGEQLGTRGAIATRLLQHEGRNVLGAEDLQAGRLGRAGCEFSGVHTLPTLAMG